MMMSKVEQTARERIKAVGNMPPNGMKVGSDLHLCEMLVAEIENLRNKLITDSQNFQIECQKAEIERYKERIVRLEQVCSIFEKNSADATELWELLREVRMKIGDVGNETIPQTLRDKIKTAMCKGK